jgi:hypothetical protein
MVSRVRLSNIASIVLRNTRAWSAWIALVWIASICCTRSVTQELPGVAQLQVVVLVSVCQLVVTDVRVLPSRDTELSRNLKLEVTDLRHQFDVRQDRVGQDPTNPCLCSL